MLQISVIFVCMGNICRSPAAECIMKSIVNSEGLEDVINIDSAGTIGFHAGSSPDPRMREEGLERDIQIQGSARQISEKDLNEFDIVIAMDKSNLQHLRELDKANKYNKKLKLFCDYVSKFQHSEVPDPYYGGKEGFTVVMDLLEDGCKNLLEDIKKQLKLSNN